MMLPTERAEAPHVPQQLLLPEHSLRILGERDQQLVLLRRELHRVPRDANDARGEVDVEVPNGQAAVRRPRHTRLSTARMRATSSFDLGCPGY
jgi:hypothetical protein